MKWVLELNGVRTAAEFHSPAAAAQWAALAWPDVPEATKAVNEDDDTPGWLVVAVQPPGNS